MMVILSLKMKHGVILTWSVLYIPFMSDYLGAGTVTVSLMFDYSSITLRFQKNHFGHSVGRQYLEIVAGGSGRIIGGEPVQPRNKYSMVVKIFNNQVGGCGGTILDKRWVITAALCVAGVKMEDVVIIAGNYDQLEPDGTEQVVGAVEFIIHDTARVTLTPKQDPSAYPDNIALIRVHPPFVFNKYVAPTNLPDITYFVNEKSGEAYIAGWGWVLSDTEDFPGPLQEAKLQLREIDHCQDVLQNHLVTESHLCAGKPYIPGECLGDEGGPLMLFEVNTDSFTQIGIYSYTLGSFPICGNTPDVFMNLARYLDWIKYQFRKNCQRKRVAWCIRNGCKNSWQCCDKLPRNFVTTIYGAMKGICYNRTLARKCLD